ncbi:MAG TPA: endonuclease/exonuclease/phosphatase family protein [Candidatus Competibacteraceae bacterium]|nr:endonuclease/exonuclease/phosphatase family protein [Candidatus Competibacteraceae bacterium]
MPLTIASYNLCNLGVDTPPPRLARLAESIATTLEGPAIVAVQEVTGSEPPDADGTVRADGSFRLLVGAIRDAGGPAYEWCEVAPRDGCDGGLAGANIRVGLLYDPARVELVCRGRAGALDTTALQRWPEGIGLSLSPGRIEPRHPAFQGDPERHWAPSRKALAAEFRVAGQPLFVVVCHLKSMRARTRREEDYAKKQRHAQAELIHSFVANLQRARPDARVVVLGDMNDMLGSKTLKLLKGELLHNPLERLPRKDCYSRRHSGCPQSLDHILLCRHLEAGARIRLPHINSDAAPEERASDHDPVLAILDAL